MWETFRDFVAAIAGLCDQSCDPKVSRDFLAVFDSTISLRLLPDSVQLGKLWEYFRSFVAAVAGFLFSTAGQNVGIFPWFRCGCCRTKSWMVTNKS